jgi:hypothetical protein
MLSLDGLERVYREAHERCVLQPRRIPSAMRMQELVTAWKLLRKWRGVAKR